MPSPHEMKQRKHTLGISSTRSALAAGLAQVLALKLPVSHMLLGGRYWNRPLVLDGSITMATGSPSFLYSFASDNCGHVGVECFRFIWIEKLVSDIKLQIIRRTCLGS